MKTSQITPSLAVKSKLPGFLLLAGAIGLAAYFETQRQKDSAARHAKKIADDVKRVRDVTSQRNYDRIDQASNDSFPASDSPAW